MNINFNVQTKLNKKEMLDKSKEVLWKSMNKMMELAVKDAPVDTGRLKNSIHLIPMSSGSNHYILTDGVDYGIHMEFGTKPHWVPVSALKGWSRRVLKNEGAAYAVQNNISKYGVEASPFFRPALIQVREYWAPLYWKQIMAQPT